MSSDSDVRSVVEYFILHTRWSQRMEDVVVCWKVFASLCRHIVLVGWKGTALFRIGAHRHRPRRRRLVESVVAQSSVWVSVQTAAVVSVPAEVSCTTSYRLVRFLGCRMERDRSM